jgi:hypothetical protein
VWFGTCDRAPDETNSCEFVERPPQILVDAIAQVQAKGHELDFKNNSALIYSAFFGFIKEKTERSWLEHNCEQQYQEAVKLARQFLIIGRAINPWHVLFN